MIFENGPFPEGLLHLPFFRKPVTLARLFRLGSLDASRAGRAHGRYKATRGGSGHGTTSQNKVSLPGTSHHACRYHAGIGSFEFGWRVALDRPVFRPCVGPRSSDKRADAFALDASAFRSIIKSEEIVSLIGKGGGGMHRVLSVSRALAQDYGDQPVRIPAAPRLLPRLGSKFSDDMLTPGISTSHRGSRLSRRSARRSCTPPWPSR